MIRALIFIMLILSISAKAQYSVSFLNKIKQTDRIEVHYLKLKKPVVYKTTDSGHLLFFKEQIIKAKSNPNLKCDSAAEIRYFRKGIQIFKAYFSSRSTGGHAGSVVAFSTDNSNIVTLSAYNVGMIIDEVYYQNTKQNK